MTYTPNIDIPLFNQRVWDADPSRAEKEALDTIHTAGFGFDCIERQVGNYEGQIMAIRRGWVEQDGYCYRITKAGIDALLANGRPVPTCLPVLDGWHLSRAQYCAWTERWIGRDGKPYGPYLKIMERAYGAAGDLAKSPLLAPSDVRALRDYLNEWLDKEGGDA